MCVSAFGDVPYLVFADIEAGNCLSGGTLNALELYHSWCMVLPQRHHLSLYPEA